MANPDQYDQANHQAGSLVRPKALKCEAKGGPLSDRMHLGKPNRENRPSNTAFIKEISAFSTMMIAKIALLYSSRTVRGQMRSWRGLYHHPLKSTVQTSFGAVG